MLNICNDFRLEMASSKQWGCHTFFLVFIMATFLSETVVQTVTTNVISWGVIGLIGALVAGFTTAIGCFFSMRKSIADLKSSSVSIKETLSKDRIAQNGEMAAIGVRLADLSKSIHEIQGEIPSFRARINQLETKIEMCVTRQEQLETAKRIEQKLSLVLCQAANPGTNLQEIIKTIKIDGD